MISREMLRDRWMRAAAAVLGIAAIVLVVAVVGAVRVGEVSAAAPPVSIPDSALKFPMAGPGMDIAQAVSRDLFADDRQAPLQRYRMPGEAEAGQAAPEVRPVVLGTAMAADGAHFATVHLGNDNATIARVGMKVGEYTVVAIERGRVTFRNAVGERVVIEASKPAP